MHLASILDQYHDAFQAKYGSRLLPSHLHAIEAIRCCRTLEAGQLLVQCTDCGHTTWRLRSCGHAVPRKWVADCTCAGQRLPALKYLSRYLYRGVIGENNIVSNQDGNITFKYVESRTGKTLHRTIKGQDFMWLVLQHVLPKGFRRVRDYGFLHGNTKKLLSLVQLILHVLMQACLPRPRPAFKCPVCQSPMKIKSFTQPAWVSG